jgi:acyl carrier protein
MTNLEKLNQIFCEVYSVEVSALNEDFVNTNVETWDSIHQLSMVAAIEEAFDLMMDAEDILEMTSYVNVKNLLTSKYEIAF